MGPAEKRRSRGGAEAAPGLPGALTCAGPGGSGLPAAAARSRQVSGGRGSRLQRLLPPRRGAAPLARPSPTRLVRSRAGAVGGQEGAGPWRLPPRFVPDPSRIGAGRGQAGGEAPGLGTWDQPPAGPGALPVRAGVLRRVGAVRAASQKPAAIWISEKFFFFFKLL